MSIHDRALGCFVGLAVGDALGAPLEFSRRDSLPPVTGYRAGGPFKLKAGDWTDDTACALALADSLFVTGGVVDRGDFLSKLARYRDEGAYIHTGKCFDVGEQTNRAISSYLASGTTRNGDEGSQGNGAIMRLAPAVIAAKSDADAIDNALSQTIATHAGYHCRAVTCMFSETLWRLIETGNASFRGVSRKHRDEISSSGHVVATHEAACWAVAKTRCFRSAVLLAANLGDDSDTVAAVAGQLAGAKYGLSSIPPEWVEGLTWRDHILDVAEKLYALRCN